MGHRFLGLVALSFLAGCAPSRESKSAGSIGCLPGDVEISEEDSSSGWGSSSETWVATCNGRRFICSENSVTGPIARGSSAFSQNLTCTEEMGNSNASSAAPNAVAQPSGKPKAGPPEAAAGFDFGSDIIKAQEACEGAGKTWTSGDVKSGECSGPVTDVGFDASVRIEFCHKQSCAITLVHQPSNNWIATFGDIKQKLSDKYGPPSLNPEGIPETCRKENQFVACLEAGKLRMHYQWEWPTRQKLELTIGKPETGDEPAAIRIKYISPQTRVRATAGGL